MSNTIWCFLCYHWGKKHVPAEVIYGGHSLCLKCLKKSVKSQKELDDLWQGKDL